MCYPPVQSLVTSAASFHAQNFGWNLLGAVTIIAWTGCTCTILFGTMKLIGLLRVSEEVEIAGMDKIRHGEPAYPVGSYEDNVLVEHCQQRSSGKLQ